MTPDQMTYDADPHALRLKKLKFRASRRGFVEADLILGAFAETQIHALAPPDLDAFEELLEQPDQPLYAWIIGTEPTPPAFDHHVMRLIRAHLSETYRTVQGCD